MNIELKPIAVSKVRQLGGDVCGVLVRKDGRLAAVDEHGRVQWLQSERRRALDAVTGIPASAGFCEPVEGYADSPMSIVSTVRVMAYEVEQLNQQLAKSEARVAEYEALTDEMDMATRHCYLSGPTVVGQFKRLRQQADEAERAGGEK